MKRASITDLTETDRGMLRVRADQMEDAIPHLPHQTWETVKITYLGISAQSTSGIRGAFHNWIAKAREIAGDA